MAKRNNGTSDIESGIGRRRLAARDESTEHYNERRAALRRSAAEMFREHGFSSTTLDQIAQRAGVDRSSLYYYVSGKTELFLDVVSEAIENMSIIAWQIRNGEGSSGEKIEKFCHAIMDNYLKYPHIYVFIQEKMTKGLNTKPMRVLRQFERQIENAIIEVIEEGIERDEIRHDISPKIAAYGILGMLNWTHRWYRPDGPFDGKEIAHGFAAMVIDGLARPASA